jgi:hypothetical protein
VIEIDEGQAPLIVLRFSGRVTASEQGDYFTKHERLLATEKPYAVMVVGRDLKPWDSAVIHRHAAWIRENAHRLRRYHRGLGLVLPSLWSKGLFRTLFRVQPLPQPYLVCATAEEARAWLDKRLLGIADASAEPPGV